MQEKTKAGKTLEAYTFEVSRVKIRELVDAIGDPNPIYRDRAAAIADGYRDTPCPPTFITMAFQEFTGFFLKVLDCLGIPLVRALHGEEEYQYLEEIYPGDLLTIEPVLESVLEKQTRAGALNLVTLRTRITNHFGAEVMRTRSLLIEKK